MNGYKVFIDFRLLWLKQRIVSPSLHLTHHILNLSLSKHLHYPPCVRIPVTSRFFKSTFCGCRFQAMGFERGWGDTAERVLQMMHLLLDILHAPDPSTLETFLGRIPMVFNVVILSPHGYFGQANVLGLPDTGGQVLSSFRDNPIVFPGSCMRSSSIPTESSIFL